MIMTINVPRINTNDDKVEVITWHVENGIYVDLGQDIVDVETSKAVMTVTAEATGYIEQLIMTGTVIRVGEPLYRIASSKEELEREPVTNLTAVDDLVQNKRPATLMIGKLAELYQSVRFSKKATLLMQSRGLSPVDFKNAGLVTARAMDGRLDFSSRKLTQQQQTVASVITTPVLAGPPTPRTENASLAKQAEIQTLSIGESGNINSMLSVHFDSSQIRARLINDQAFDGNIQPLILFEISRLLKQWPQYTAYFQDNKIHYYDRVDLGIAIDLGKGLKVVTIKEADKLMPIDFFEKTIEIGIRYVENRLRPDELVGSCLTITDLSGFDILHFHPLINGNQAAIIGIGGDSSQMGYPMSINMTFDHRVSDGRQVAIFLTELRTRLISYAKFIEQPEYKITTQYRVPPTTNAIVDNKNSCDTCGIDLITYYKDFGRDAYMLAYFREDCTMGSVCHRCYGRWI